jgi:Zn-dependent protease
MGRITLNPVAHFDPIGFLAIVFFPIGWGKPVPYVERNLRHPIRDGMFIAAAGPVSNLILAAISGVLLRVLLYVGQFGIFDGETISRLLYFFIFLISWSLYINLALCFFNLIMLFPLDGEKILLGLLPPHAAYKVMEFRQFAPMALLMLFVFGSDIIFQWINIMATPFAYLFSGLTFQQIFNVLLNAFHLLW